MVCNCNSSTVVVFQDAQKFVSWTLEYIYYVEFTFYLLLIWHTDHLLKIPQHHHVHYLPGSSLHDLSIDTI